MWRCPRCELEFDDAKICKGCGAILVEVANTTTPEPVREPPPPPPADRPDPAADEPNPPAVNSWFCRGCAETIEAQFDTCWNCGADRAIAEDPRIRRAFEAAREKRESARAAKAAAARRASQPGMQCCLRCGSDRVMRDVIVVDKMQHRTGELEVVVYGDPDAWLWKDALHATLKTDICGDCGHVEWRITDSAKLYDHYTRTAR